MGVVRGESEGRGVLRQGIQNHAEKIYREFAVDVVEVIFIFAIVFHEVRLVNFFRVVEVIRAFGADTLIEDKMFPVLYGNEGVPAMGTVQLQGRETIFVRGERSITGLAQELPFGTIVLVEKRFRGIAARAGAVVRDVAFRAVSDRPDLLAVALFVVRDEIFVRPVLAEVCNQREFINFELMVLWGMGIIKGPLFERDISANEVEHPAILLVKVLNDRK